jgi:hypothetical protein
MVSGMIAPDCNDLHNLPDKPLSGLLFVRDRVSLQVGTTLIVVCGG